MKKRIPTKEEIECRILILGSEDGLARNKARKSLIRMGKPAVNPLISALRKSKVNQVRWEVAKALVAISDTKAIPALLKALEDKDPDVAWLAAEGLEKMRMAAWPKLMRLLIRRGTESYKLRQGAHHILHNQRVEEYDDLLKILITALETETGSISIPLAAFNLLVRMKE